MQQFFIPIGLARKVDAAMESLGFEKSQRHWTNPKSRYWVEFPPGPVSIGEETIHDFAERVGIPRRGFQGDHYDIPEEYRDDMIAGGAVVVESRELVRRLRAAGLRLTPAQRRARTGA